MKKLLLVIGLGVTTLSAEATIQVIDDMVVKIQQPREGVMAGELESISNPFIILSKKDDNSTKIVATIAKEEQFVLRGIVNDRVFINNRWYKAGDKISGYTLEYIGLRGIVLADDKHIKKIFFHEPKEGFIKTKDVE